METQAAHTKPRGITDKTWQSLAPKTKRFVAEFLKDGNALRAYTVAGYVTDRPGIDNDTLRRNAYAVTKGKRVSKAILEHAEHRAALAQAKADFALDWIVSEHERLMGLAEEKGDLAVATRNLELIGRTRGAYRDNMVVDVAQQREYTEAEQIEGARLARLLLTEGAGEPAAAVEDAEAKVQRMRDAGGRYADETPATPAAAGDRDAEEDEAHAVDLTAVAVPVVGTIEGYP